MDPNSVYQHAKDKQRIVVTGNAAHMICLMIAQTLDAYGRKFSFISNGELSGGQPVSDSSAPLVIIEESRKPYTSLIGYHHHIGIISALDDDAEVIANISRFADLTPKAGNLIFDNRSQASAIGKKARPDVSNIEYGPFASKEDKGILYLVSSTDERFPVKQKGDAFLRAVSAAREILKKTGISSGQFYQAIGSFETIS